MPTSLLIKTYNPIASKKSGQVIRRGRGGRPFIAQNDKTKACEKSLADLFRKAARGKQIFGTDSIRVVVDINKTTGLNTIFVESICEKPKGTNGRRQDPVNQVQLVLDALEESGVIVNDNQAADVRVRRFVRDVCR